MKRIAIPGTMAIVLVAVIVLGAVGIGFAYTAVTTSGGNGYSVFASIEATDSYGDTNIQLPSTSYTKNGNLYMANQLDMRLNGNLKVSYKDNSTQNVCVWIQLGNPLSWTIIQAIYLTVDGASQGMLYEYRTDAPYSESCASSNPIPLTKGVHTFELRVIYRDNLQHDPSAYSGDNLVSKIVFIQGNSNPFA